MTKFACFLYIRTEITIFQKKNGYFNILCTGIDTYHIIYTSISMKYYIIWFTKISEGSTQYVKLVFGCYFFISRSIDCCFVAGFRLCSVACYSTAAKAATNFPANLQNYYLCVVCRTDIRMLSITTQSMYLIQRVGGWSWLYTFSINVPSLILFFFMNID